MSVIRVAHRARYVTFDALTAEDKRLSFKAFGILAYLLSRPDDWEVQIDHLVAAREHDGRQSVRSGLNELERSGYIQRRRIQDDRGRFVGWEHVVYERPEGIQGDRPKSDPPTSGNRTSDDTPEPDIPRSEGVPKSDSPTSENRPLPIRKRSTTTPPTPPRASAAQTLPGMDVASAPAEPRPGGLLTHVFTAWKTERAKNGNTNFSDARKRVIRTALAAYPLQDCLDAIKGAALDPWPERRRHDDLTVLLRTSGSRNNLEFFRDLYRASQPAGDAPPPPLPPPLPPPIVPEEPPLKTRRS